MFTRRNDETREGERGEKVITHDGRLGEQKQLAIVV